MHARSTTYRADPSRVEAGIAFVRNEVAPALGLADGCTGVSLSVDRAGGRCIATAGWLDEESMSAGEGRDAALRGRGAQVFGVAPVVETWDIAGVHRADGAGPQAWVRATWTRVDPALAASSLDRYFTVTLPALGELPGFCSASLFVDHEGGRSVSSVAFRTHEAMEGSRLAAAALRRTAVEADGIQVLEVRELELALAHLRVPETVSGTAAPR